MSQSSSLGHADLLLLTIPTTSGIYTSSHLQRLFHHNY
ncbi:hypothetical protein NC651_004087 [Populus alba x Populus x berolinensis]|nr:hypothetical protein NC651_004087 [Populus alba x Populus x berolinensis]